MNGRYLEKGFLTSKIARRFFLLFIFCALLPLLTISGVSYFFVSHQLKAEAYKRLRQQGKTKGFEIYERLLSLEAQLEAMARDISQGRWPDQERPPYDPSTREGSRFKSVSFVNPHSNGLKPIHGEADLGPRISRFDPLPPDLKGQSFIKIQKDKDNPFATVRMHHLLDPSDPSKGILVAEIDPLYLWGIGVEGSLPPDVEMTVCSPGDQVLITSFDNYEFSRSFLNTFALDPFSGTFDSSKNGRAYINTYWSLFLRHRFATPDWSIILSQSKTSILEPVSRFSLIFLLLLLLTFWVIVLLSIVTIRKRMVPLEAFKTGATFIAEGNFDHRITITSGDEFEMLADTFNDMSQKLKHSQAILLQAAKMSAFGQMAAGIVHEIGQPLSSISGYTDLLVEDVQDEETQKYLSIMRSEIRRLIEIISKFRTFSRTAPERFEAVHVNDILLHTHHLLEHQLSMQNVQFDLQLQEEIPFIDADKNELQQVFLNLVMNAIDALEDRPRENRHVTIRTSAHDDWVVVDIEDNGCGIAPEHQQAIFEPFFTTKSEEKGTGLGLAVLQSILHKHHAEIDVKSQLEKGTCFTLRFPGAQLE